MLVNVETQRPTFESIAGVVHYVFRHLAATKEAGPFLRLPKYLDDLGRVRPFVSHPEVWAQVGWDVTTPLPPKLVTNLLVGRDLHGNQLVVPRPGGTGWQQPKEEIVSGPCELSEILWHDDPAKAYRVAQDLAQEYFKQLDAAVVRVRVGGGFQEWREAFCLSLIYPHFENKLGEPQFHMHPFTFAITLDHNGIWRTRDDAKHLRNLQGKGLPIDVAAEICGRRLLTDQMIQTCHTLGIAVELDPKFASQEGRVPHGATVTSGAQIILAGDVGRERRAGVLASRQVKTILGVPAPTRREAALLLSNGGDPLAALRVRKPEDLKRKADHLGLLDPGGSLIRPELMRTALGVVADRLAVAEVHLSACRRLPGDYERAAEMVRDSRLSLSAALGLAPGPPPPDAQAEWFRDHLRALAWAQRGPQARHDLDRPPWLLRDHLKNAGYIELDPKRERPGYRLTAAGEDRLARARIGNSILVPRACSRLGPGHGTRSGTVPEAGDAASSAFSRYHANTGRREPGGELEVQPGTPGSRPLVGNRPSVPATGVGVGHPLSSRGLPRLGPRQDPWFDDDELHSGPPADPLSFPGLGAHAPGRLQPAPSAPLRNGFGASRTPSRPAHGRLADHRSGAAHGEGHPPYGGSPGVSVDEPKCFPGAPALGGLQSGLGTRQEGAAKVPHVASRTPRPSSSMGLLMGAGKHGLATLPRWLQAMLESPLAGFEARHMLHASSMSAGSVSAAPAWEPTPAQRAEQDRFDSPRVVQDDFNTASTPAYRHRLP